MRPAPRTCAGRITDAAISGTHTPDPDRTAVGEDGEQTDLRCPFTGSCGIDPGCPKPTWADLGEGEPHRCLKGPVPAISRVSWSNAATITPPTTHASTRVDVEATQPATAFGVTSARRTPNCVRICWRAWAVTIG